MIATRRHTDRRTRAGLLAAASVIAIALPASAADRGWYLGGRAGVNGALDASISGTGVASEAEYDTGGAFIFSLGYAWQNVRVEGEFGYRTNDVDSLVGSPE